MHDNHNLPAQGGESPFDAIKTVTPEGREYWSARDLMPLLGYDEWRKFAGAIERARVSAHNAGYDVTQNFVGADKVIPGQRGPAQADFHLSRYACYLVALNGDPRKPEIAAAQTYFVIRTREAETATPQFEIPSTYAEALAAAAEQAKQVEVEQKRNLQLVAAISRDAPLVAKAEAHTASDSMIHRQAFAREVQQWGVKQGVKVLHEYVYELLRRKGMLVSGERSDRNHATSHAVTAGWAWTKKDTTDTGHATATTYLHPRGQDIAWKWITAHVNEFGTLTPQAGAA